MGSIDAVPLVIAEQNGYFEEEGVDLDLQIFKAANDRDAALQAGELDGVLCDETAISIYQNSGIDMKITGTTNGSCVDEDGKGICQLYQITVTNTGNVISTLSSKIELYAVGENSKFTNLKWAEINSATDATPFGKVHTMNDQNWKTSFVMGPGSSSKFYILIWLSDTGKSQNNYDRGNFAGTVQFNSTAGTGANATFIG